MSVGYDEAVFIQKCKRAAPFGRITEEQVTDCLVACMPDIFDAIPPERRPAAREHIRKEYVRSFKWCLDEAGLVLV